MTNHSRRLAIGAAAVALTIAAVHVRASTVLDRHEVLTFRRAVALPGVNLAPGAYVFELADPDTATVIRVRNRDTRRVVFQGFTNRTARPAGRPDGHVTLGESSRGTPPPVLAWYPSEQELGYQFIYRGAR